LAAVRVAAGLVGALLSDSDHAPVLLNVNFPKGCSWKVVPTRLGSRVYHDGVDIRRDPRNREYLWLGGPPGTRHGGGPDADTVVFDHGMVGVTPLVLSLWESREMERAGRVAGTMG
jgi:broad specificity polyphosphatase/5'/3'-nucleotidase SurE